MLLRDVAELPDRQRAAVHQECDHLESKAVPFGWGLHGKGDHPVRHGTKVEDLLHLGWFGFGWSVVAVAVPDASWVPRIRRTDVDEEFVPDVLAALVDQSAGAPTWDEAPCDCWHRLDDRPSLHSLVDCDLPRRRTVWQELVAECGMRWMVLRGVMPYAMPMLPEDEISAPRKLC